MSNISYNEIDVVWLEGNSQASFSTSNTAAQSAALDGGIYHVWAGVDTYIKVAETADDVTTSTGYLLRANNTIPLHIKKGHKLGAILGGSSGTIAYHKVSR